MKNKTVVLFVMGIFAINTLYSQKFTIYNTKNSKISDNYITDIEIYNNIIWLGTLNGISKYDGFNWVTYNVSNSVLLHPIITDLSISSIGQIWVANYNKGVVCFDGFNWKRFNTKNSLLSSDDMVSVMVDQHNIKWFSTYRGLNTFDGVHWKTCSKENSDIPDNDIRKIDFERNGQIWVPTWYGGVARCQDGNCSVFNISNSILPSNSVSVVKVDINQNVWMGTVNGLVRFDGTCWTLFDTCNSPLPDNDVRAIEFNEEGAVIVGTKSGGLAVYNGESWMVYNSSNTSLPSDRVTSLKYDKRTKILWVGTSKGLVEMSGLMMTLEVENSVLKETEISPYPNPSKGLFKIKLPKGECNINIFDTSGKLVKTLVKQKEDVLVDLIGLAKGCYFVHIDVKNQIITKKILIE